jgi:site-specific DNA-methyltransferase (adenine-specific)
MIKEQKDNCGSVRLTDGKPPVGSSTVILGDCVEVMKGFADKQFDLAIVDPEYGLDAGNMTMGSGKNKKYTKKDWDKKTPEAEYFEQLFRVSKNQIICGGNYFADKLPISKGWIFWDKGINGDCSFADGELIWTSFDTVLRKADIRYKGFLGADKERIHITQKPIRLYKWILQNYAKPGEIILDTHLGSQSSRIAADEMGFNFTGIEIDIEYYENGNKRYNNYKSQLRIEGW